MDILCLYLSRLTEKTWTLPSVASLADITGLLNRVLRPVKTVGGGRSILVTLCTTTSFQKWLTAIVGARASVCCVVAMCCGVPPSTGHQQPLMFTSIPWRRRRWCVLNRRSMYSAARHRMWIYRKWTSPGTCLMTSVDMGTNWLW